MLEKEEVKGMITRLDIEIVLLTQQIDHVTQICRNLLDIFKNSIAPNVDTVHDEFTAMNDLLYTMRKALKALKKSKKHLEKILED